MANTAFGAAFDKALRAYHTGGITYNDFLSEIDAQMAAGASVSELLDVLWRREQIEPLPPPIHAAVIARIEKPLRQSMPQEPADTAGIAQAREALPADEFMFSWDTAPIPISAGEQQDLSKLAEFPDPLAVGQAAATRMDEPRQPANAAKPDEVAKLPEAAHPPAVSEPHEVSKAPAVSAPLVSEAPEVVKPPPAAPPPALPKAAELVQPPPDVSKLSEAALPPAIARLSEMSKAPAVSRAPEKAKPPTAAKSTVSQPPEVAKPPAVSKPAERATSADQVKPAVPTAAVKTQSSSGTTASLTEASKPAELAKPAETANPAKPPEVVKPAEVPKADDVPRRLGKAIARELQDWLSPARPGPSAPPSVISPPPKQVKPEPIALPAGVPRVATPRVEAPTVLDDLTTRPIIATQLSAVPADTPRVDVEVFNTPRVSTSRLEPPTVILDDRTVPPVVAAPRTDTPRVATPAVDTPRVDVEVFNTPRVSTSRPEPPTVILDDRTAPPVVAAPRTDMPRTDMPRTDMPRLDTPGVVTPRVDVSVFETPRVSTSRLEPPTVLADRTPPPVAAPRTDTPRLATPGVATPRVDVSVFETPRVSTSRPEPPTVILDDRTAPPVVAAPRTDTPRVDVEFFNTPRVSTSGPKTPTVLDDGTSPPVAATPRTEPPFVSAASVAKPVLETLRISTARAEAPTVVLGDRTVAPVSVQTMPSTADFFGGRFRLIEQVADSDMSRVYRAEDVMVPKAERRIVALKVFKRSVSGDANAAAAQSEFARLRALSHPNIVQMIECGISEGALFVTMEWLTGMSLYRRLDALAARHEARGLPAREARNVISGVAAALEYAHARGVVHGDLKPGNVFLCSDGTVKLIDFGMSTWFAQGPFMTTTPVVATPRYASPQVMARQSVTQADDVYAFACVVYEIMSGRYPFVGVGGVEDARFVPLRRPEFSTSQYAALLNGLAQDAAQRAPSVHDFMRQFSTGGRVRRASGKWAAFAILLLGGGWLLYASGIWQSAAALLKMAPSGTSAVNGVAPQSTFRDCRLCPLMAVIPAGRFVQDLPDAPGSHAVVIAQPFAMSANAVTVAEYQAFVTATRRDVRGCDVYDGSWRRRLAASFKDPGFVQAVDHPVTCVSWTDAVAYTDWLTQTTGHVYRLPSAAAWEYAARAGANGTTPWESDGNACAVANVADHSAAERYKGWSVFACSDGFMYTSPVAAFPANAFGLHDMLGNVLEWTLDCWQPNSPGAPADGSARGGRDCRQHEVRGASWFSSPSAARIARREHYAASYRISTTGMRVVRQVDQ